MSFDEMTPTEFEAFCFDLLKLAGFVNVDWRKGSVGEASPADSGRDIEAVRRQEDLDGHQHDEKWNVDAKHYTKSAVPPDALLSLMTWSHSSAPQVALVITSGYLSNPAKNWIAALMGGSNQPPFRVRYWERPTLVDFIRQFPVLLERHRISISPFRTQGEIAHARRELEDIVWYGDIQKSREVVGEEAAQLSPTTQQRIDAVEQRYERSKLYPWSSTSEQFNRGRLATLRWAMGEHWPSDLDSVEKDGESDD